MISFYYCREGRCDGCDLHRSCPSRFGWIEIWWNIRGQSRRAGIWVSWLCVCIWNHDLLQRADLQLPRHGHSFCLPRARKRSKDSDLHLDRLQSQVSDGFCIVSDQIFVCRDSNCVVQLMQVICKPVRRLESGINISYLRSTLPFPVLTVILLWCWFIDVLDIQWEPDGCVRLLSVRTVALTRGARPGYRSGEESYVDDIGTRLYALFDFDHCNCRLFIWVGHTFMLVFLVGEGTLRSSFEG